MSEITNLWKKIILEGEIKTDRTGVGTKSIFGGQLVFDLRDRFPLLTIKKTLWKSAFIEMLWFLRGEDNTDFLKQHKVPIWDDWADQNGKLGPIYGVQWRKWKKYNLDHKNSAEIVEHLDGSLTHLKAKVSVVEIDQIKQLIDKLKNKPNDRRMIVSAWNVADVEQMGLPPCHRDFQCYVSEKKYLDLMMSQRSWDLGLGAPFNVSQYALLQHLLARATGLTPRYLKINYGDAHLYTNHLQPIQNLIDNHKDIDCQTELVFKTDNTDIDGYKIEDFDIKNYVHGPFVPLPIAV